MSDARWFRQDVDWWEQDWCSMLSSEAQLCWDRLQCRVGAVGQRGRIAKTAIPLLARQWLVGEESIRQMLTAAIKGGRLHDHGDEWEVADPSIYAKDPTATERKQAQREREKEDKMSRMSRDARDVTVQDKTRQDIQDNTSPKSPKGDLVVTSWEIFLATYPTRSGDRGTARGKAKFAALVKGGADVDEILAGVERYRKWCDHTNIRGTAYVKQIPTFLNGQCWLEPFEILPSKNQGSAPRRTMDEVTLAQ